MKRVRSIAMLVLAAWACASAVAQKPARQAARQAAAQERKAENQAKRQAAANNNPPGELHPGDIALQRFVKMTPEERQNAIARLPPQRQRQILQRLQQYETMAPQAKERVVTQLELLHNLPPQRQNQVRRSLQDLQTLPDDRKVLVRQELAKLSAMPDEERKSRMNSEEFRNVYSPLEQQMMGNIAEVLPRRD